MTNMFRLILNHFKILSIFVTFIAFTLLVSCAQKQSAIDRLINKKRGDKTEILFDKEKEKQHQEGVSADNNKQTQDTDEQITKEVEKSPAPDISEGLDIFSKAIIDVTDEIKKTNKDRQVQKLVFITRESVNLRSGPGMDFPVVSKVSKGDKFQLIRVSEEKHNGKPWYEISTSSKAKAFVWSDLALVLEKYADEKILTTTVISSAKGIDKIPTPSIPKNMQKEYVSLNFESTDLKDIIITFCELLQIDYILDPKISGKITLQTFKKVHINDLFRVLEKILVLNNLTVIKTGNFFRFMPIIPAKKETFHVFFGNDGDDIPPVDRLIVQIIPLKYVLASSMKKIIKPLLSKQAQFLDVPDTNNLIIIDTANSVKRILDIINVLDVNALDKLQVKLFPMEFTMVEDLASEIGEIFTALGYANTGKSTVLKFVPIARLNSLLVVNTFPELLKTIEFWISNLDKPIIEGFEKRTYVYYIQNAKADQLAGILNQLYKADAKKLKMKPAQRKAKERALQRRKKPGIASKGKKSPLLVEVKSALQGEVSGEILIIPDQFTNALLIRTDPRNYPAILDTIKHLDLMPLQVLIEVLVLELTLDEQTRAGLDWAYKGNATIGSSPTGGITVGGNLGESATALLSQGFSAVSATKDFTVLLNAFAEDSKLSVLSNPVIITSENMPATINIINDIPVETTSISTPTAGQPLTETTIQYRSVGIKLSVTPRINKDRFVTLLVEQEVSNVNEAATFTQPSFFSRSTSTNVVVKDNQSLVIGGLMSENYSYVDSGIPFLKDIPFIGYLFKATSRRKRKTELIIFVTPRVIASISEADDATKRFRARLLDLKPALLKKE